MFPWLVFTFFLKINKISDRNKNFHSCWKASPFLLEKYFDALKEKAFWKAPDFYLDENYPAENLKPPKHKILDLYAVCIHTGRQQYLFLPKCLQLSVCLQTFLHMDLSFRVPNLYIYTYIRTCVYVYMKVTVASYPQTVRNCLLSCSWPWYLGLICMGTLRKVAGTNLP